MNKVFIYFKLISITLKVYSNDVFQEKEVFKI